MITITPVLGNMEEIPDICLDLGRKNSAINYKEELFKSYNICIKHPMFYVAILKDVLKEHFPKDMHPALLGSIVECHVRGLLPEEDALEYKDVRDREIDYINVRTGIAIEITISNKRARQLNFNCVPKDYMKVELTKDILEVCVNDVKVPYHEFIRMAANIYTERLSKRYIAETLMLKL